jgi:hypothetical protein
MKKDRIREELLKARDDVKRQLDVIALPNETGFRPDMRPVTALLESRLNEIERELKGLNPNSSRSIPKPMTRKRHKGTNALNLR